MKLHHGIAFVGAFVVIALLIMFILSLSGCGNVVIARPTLPTVPAMPALHTAAVTPTSQADAIIALQHDRSIAIGQLATLTAQLATAQSRDAADKQAAKLVPIIALCDWASYIGVAMVIIGMGWAALTGLIARWVPVVSLLTRFVPLGWQAGLAVAATGLVIAAVALTVGVVLPWLVRATLIAAGGGLIAGALWVIAHYRWALRTLWHLTQEEAAEHPQLAKALQASGVTLPAKNPLELVPMSTTTTLK